MTLLNPDAFNPLSSAPTARPQDEFRVAVVADTSAARPISSLAQHLGAGGGASGQPGCEPKVSLQRDGDRITHIRVHCSCGQVMELVCDYGAGDQQA